MIRRALAIPVGVTVLTLLLLRLAGPQVGAWFSGALVVVALVDWWAFVILYRLARRNPDVALLQGHASIALVITIAGALLGFIGVNYLTGSHLPRGVALALLLVALMTISMPLPLFVLDYYRGGRR